MASILGTHASGRTKYEKAGSNNIEPTREIWKFCLICNNDDETQCLHCGVIIFRSSLAVTHRAI